MYRLPFRPEVYVNGSLFYGNGSRSPQGPWGAGNYLDASKKYGLKDEYGLGMWFYNRIAGEVFYSHDYFIEDHEAIPGRVQSQYPDYFIDRPSVNSGYDIYSKNSRNLRYWRMGLSANIRLSRNKYIQPFVFYGIGKTDFPVGSLAFKSNSSNNVGIVSYKFEGIPTKGYVAGLRFHLYSDGNAPGEPFPFFGHIGIKVEYASMEAMGTGTVTCRDLMSGAEVVNVAEVSKRFQYFSVGVFFGIGVKGKRYSGSFLFSKWPYKARKSWFKK